MTVENAKEPRPCRTDDEAQEPGRGERHPGLPTDATVVSEETFTSPKGRRYRILKTRQTDPYDAPAEGEERGP